MVDGFIPWISSGAYLRGGGHTRAFPHGKGEEAQKSRPSSGEKKQKIKNNRGRCQNTSRKIKGTRVTPGFAGVPVQELEGSNSRTGWDLANNFKKENSMNDQSDHDLIQQIKSGHIEFYGNLIRRYRQKVMGSCLALLNNRTDAEEATQDIFVKAYLALDRFKGDSTFSTWVYRIAANHCLDILRSRNRRKTVSLNALVEKNGNHFQGLSAVPEKAASNLEDRQLVHLLLLDLPPHYRTILTMREAEGIGIREIADVMKCTLTAARGRLTRARQKARKNLGMFLEIQRA